MRVLVAGRNAKALARTASAFARDLQIATATTKAAAFALLDYSEFELVIACELLGDGSGLEVLSHVAVTTPDTLRIFAARPATLAALKGELGLFGLFRTLAYPINFRKLWAAIDLARSCGGEVAPVNRQAPTVHEPQTPAPEADQIQGPQIRHVVLEDGELPTGAQAAAGAGPSDLKVTASIGPRAAQVGLTTVGRGRASPATEPFPTAWPTPNSPRVPAGQPVSPAGRTTSAARSAPTTSARTTSALTPGSGPTPASAPTRGSASTTHLPARAQTSVRPTTKSAQQTAARRTAASQQTPAAQRTSASQQRVVTGQTSVTRQAAVADQPMDAGRRSPAARGGMAASRAAADTATSRAPAAQQAAAPQQATVAVARATAARHAPVRSSAASRPQGRIPESEAFKRALERRKEQQLARLEPSISPESLVQLARLATTRRSTYMPRIAGGARKRTALFVGSGVFAACAAAFLTFFMVGSNRSIGSAPLVASLDKPVPQSILPWQQQPAATQPTQATAVRNEPVTPAAADMEVEAEAASEQFEVEPGHPPPPPPNPPPGPSEPPQYDAAGTPTIEE